MNLNSLLKEKHDHFLDLCKRHKVKKIYAFGSSVTECFDPTKSDIDLVVERHLGIIGEAVNKFLKESVKNELMYSQEIISPEE